MLTIRRSERIGTNVTEQEILKALIGVTHRMRKVNIETMNTELPQHDFFMLHAIFMHEKNTGNGIYVSELAKLMNVSSPAISRKLGVLEIKGWIDRKIDLSNRRNTYVCLTKKGLQVQENSSKKMEKFFGKVIHRMGIEDMKQILSLWEKLTDCMEIEMEEMNQKNGGQYVKNN